jgi:signal transduction histidine kinase
MHSVAELPWSRVAAFVRQHTHDVRNDLNSLDLESSLLSDIVTDDEAKESISRMRRQIRQCATKLKALSAKFSDPRPIPGPISARDLFEIWREQAEDLNEPLEMSWDSKLGEESVSVDVALVALALHELLENASTFSAGAKIAASAFSNEDAAIFELEESKPEPVDPKGWCINPLQSNRRGGYGLGLWQAQRIVQAHGGELKQRYIPEGKSLVSTVRLPFA